jgi:hypothetical protein
LLLWRWDMLHLLHWMIPLAGKTEYKFVAAWSIRMTQVTRGGRTVYVQILPSMHFISMHLAVPIWCPNSQVHMSLFYWSSDDVFLAAHNVVTAVHNNMCNPWPSWLGCHRNGQSRVCSTRSVSSPFIHSSITSTWCHNSTTRTGYRKVSNSLPIQQFSAVSD